ncbi:MAG: MFS transporter, partial [candidate division Zixibacteria bacterium]|nr:MFS transporter [candidate division Zixibacteria bacterium]
FPHRERGKGIGLMTMMVSAGLMTGPPLGGFMLEIWPWQSIFVINLPIGLLGLLLCFRYFKTFPAPVIDRELRLSGAFVLSGGLLMAMIGLTFINDYPLTDVRILGPWVISFIALGTFIRLESKPQRALIGRDLLRNHQFTLGITVMLLMFTALSGTLILIPFYLQDVKNFPPRVIGLFLILLPVLMFMCAPMAGRLSDRIGYRLLTSGGMLVFAVGLYCLAGLDRITGNAYIIGSLALVGIGVGIFSTPNSSAMMGSVSKKQRAISSGILSTTRNIGMGLGVALSTALFSYFRDNYTGSGDELDAFVYGFGNIIWLPVILTLGGALLCLMRKNRIASKTEWDDNHQEESF